jgi:ATP-dependent DNA helicase RecG
MVPTEILGRQHLAFIAPIAARLGICVDILTGSLKSKEHREVRARIESGTIDIIIGTHALFQESVEFANLGLVVMDEQHRFGVEQRLKLTSKGRHPHILQMTATPIPRSLTMTAFGDMEVSQIKQKPPGRKPIDTRAIPISRADEIIEAIGRAVNAGGKVYWICPLIEEQDDDEIMRLDLAAAEARFTEFTARFGTMVGLVHGRMKSPEREAVMACFAGGDCKILVATTVIEVGVNVPDATIMVIEHAERFGLSQLHQLRGRVGRSEKSSTCILLYADMAGKTAQDRLRVMRETEDGFDIAEQDLRIRGGGEVLGTKQSGMPDFHFADLVRHRDLIFTARDDVKLILHRDPKLESLRGLALRTLLYLYSYDENIRYLDSG